MRKLASLIALTMLLNGCAHQPIPPQRLHPSADVRTTKTTTPARIGLPYIFYRHGVEIKVYSAEFSPSELLVTVRVQETRGEEVQLDVSKFVEARQASGETLAFTHYSRSGKIQESTMIDLQAHEQTLLEISFNLNAGAKDSAVELHFPTGKWWSSESQP